MSHPKDYADDIKSAIDEEIGSIETAASNLTTRVENLETTVNTDHETRLDTLEGAATLEGSVKYQVKQASDAINATIGTVESGKTVVQMIADAKTAATYDDTQVKADIAANTKAIGDEVTRAKAAEQANATAIATDTNINWLRLVDFSEVFAQLSEQVSGEITYAVNTHDVPINTINGAHGIRY